MGTAFWLGFPLSRFGGLRRPIQATVWRIGIPMSAPEPDIALAPYPNKWEYPIFFNCIWK
ncbi:MAG: hypothetical protein BGP09_24185 [Rhizobium sp. 60-20]|nr:MAG: hypothetical protein BGP09_24185 [Rhizobium sp. 60-20]